MKKIFLALVVSIFLTESCSYHYHYYSGDTACLNHSGDTACLNFDGATAYLTTSPDQKTPYLTISSGKKKSKGAIKYDRAAPDIKLPEVEKASANYDPSDYKTFAVYTKLHTVEQPAGGAMTDKDAIWCTKEGTYLARVDKMLWNERYFHTQSGCYLRDSRTGKKYPLRKVWGLPLDETYWLHSVAGEWFCRVFEFPPLDPGCTHIDIIYNKKPLKHIEGTTGWGHPQDELNISIAELQANQSKMKFKPTVIVK